jgi:NADPH-dependent 7-cyano-7-deazaguanine reductase QueF
MEQLVEECVDNAMAELRRALPPEELEIYEKCYRFFKRSNSTAIRWYTSEQILRRLLILRGEE